MRLGSRGDDAARRALLQPVEEELAEQKRRQVVDRPGLFDAVLRQLPCSVHRAGVVDEHIQLSIAGQHLGGQSAHRGLRREVGDECRHRGSSPGRRPDTSRRNARPGLAATDDGEVRAKCGERFCRRQADAIGGTRDQDLLIVHGTAIQGSGHARTIFSIIFDCWRGNAVILSMLSRAQHEKSPLSMRNKNLRKGSQETRMQDIRADTEKRGPSSRVLQEVIRQAPAEYVTVGWLTSTLHRDSFGIVMLCLGVLATTPVGSTVPGLILAVMAVQLIVGRGKPAFPHFIMTRRLPTKQLLRLGGLAIHVLKYLEKAVHPRWPMTFEVAKHAVGVMVLLLTLVLLLTPVPLSNVAPAMVISLISLAYVEEDGLLLTVGFLAAIILIGLGSAAVWGTIIGAVLISA